MPARATAYPAIRSGTPSPSRSPAARATGRASPFSRACWLAAGRERGPDNWCRLNDGRLAEPRTDAVVPVAFAGPPSGPGKRTPRAMRAPSRYGRERLHADSSHGPITFSLRGMPHRRTEVPVKKIRGGPSVRWGHPDVMTDHTAWLERAARRTEQEEVVELVQESHPLVSRSVTRLAADRVGGEVDVDGIEQVRVEHGDAEGRLIQPGRDVLERQLDGHVAGGRDLHDAEVRGAGESRRQEREDGPGVETGGLCDRIARAVPELDAGPALPEARRVRAGLLDRHAAAGGVGDLVREGLRVVLHSPGVR